MNEELRKLLEDVKRYIERMEVQIDGEWGSCREVEELQEQDLMPELYARVNAALAKAAERWYLGTADKRLNRHEK